MDFHFLSSLRSSLPNFFFFQAEDGIRDVAVTGVQTCALPIWYDTAESARPQPDGDVTRFAGSQRDILAVVPVAVVVSLDAYHSLKSPACSCVSITLPASS